MAKRENITEYTVEREYLGKITCNELVENIIKMKMKHGEHEPEEETVFDREDFDSELERTEQVLQDISDEQDEYMWIAF